MNISTEGSYGAHHAGANPSAGIPSTTPTKWRPFVAPGKLCSLVDTEQLDEFWPFCNFSKRFYYLNRYLMNVIRRSEAVNDEAKYHKVKNVQKCWREWFFHTQSSEYPGALVLAQVDERRPHIVRRGLCSGGLIKGSKVGPSGREHGPPTKSFDLGLSDPVTC